MNEKQTQQQHRQHFNLSEETKQKLEELTARRYPGKQRRQSQLVEDLIAEAFTKERSMSTGNAGTQEPYDRLAPASYEALNLAQNKARRMRAKEFLPEHLLLVLLEMGHHKTLKALNSLTVNDVQRIFERLTTQGWRLRRREELLDELKPGEVRRGIVSNLANFGAFVDLGGAEGLVHISQLTWSHVKHPSELLKIGQEVEVQVLSVDKEKKKIALSINRAGVDPWTTVASRYTPGQLVRGTITRVAPFGAFARIEDGVEGLIHSSELTPGINPRTSVREGQVLQLRILRIDADRRILELSLRQADEPDPVVIKDVPLEESYPTGETATSTSVGELDDNITISPQLLQCINRAVETAKRMRSELVQPMHLLIGVLQDERIQSILAPWLPSPEILSNPGVLIGFTSDEQIQPGSCPSCRSSVQTHWKHCVYCGRSLAIVCPKCGTPRAEVEGVRFCFECGSPLVNEND